MQQVYTTGTSGISRQFKPQLQRTRCMFCSTSCLPPHHWQASRVFCVMAAVQNPLLCQFKRKRCVAVASIWSSPAMWNAPRPAPQLSLRTADTDGDFSKRLSVPNREHGLAVAVVQGARGHQRRPGRGQRPAQGLRAGARAHGLRRVRQRPARSMSGK